MRTSTNHTKLAENTKENQKGMAEKKVEGMAVPATNVEKTGQEAKKLVKAAKKEAKIFVEFGGYEVLY